MIVARVLQDFECLSPLIDTWFSEAPVITLHLINEVLQIVLPSWSSCSLNESLGRRILRNLVLDLTERHKTL